MSDADLLALYSARLLGLAADIPRQGRLAAPDATVSRRAPLCGSTVSVDLSLRDGRVADFAQVVRACALGQAAASVVGATILGRTPAEIREGRDALRAMLADGASAPAAPWDGFEALMAARGHANRHGSILLAIEAALEAAETAAWRPATK